LIKESLLNLNKKIENIGINSSKIYFELSDKEIIFSVKTGEKVDKKVYVKSNLIFKMEETTFNNLVNGEIHPEDLMFNEKIKIFGDINLISNKKGD
jgi:putative sterol carrier protein